MRKILFITTALFGLCFLSAQSVIGKWKTIDDETGKPKSIVEIYKKSDGKIYGKIVQLLIKPENENCVKCKGSMKDKPLIGLEIVKGLSADGSEYTDGDITDPKTGKTYSCTISLEGKDKLKVRGYMGISLLGRTQYWHRVN